MKHISLEGIEERGDKRKKVFYVTVSPRDSTYIMTLANQNQLFVGFFIGPKNKKTTLKNN